MDARRRGIVMVYVTVAMVAFVGFVSLAVDVARVRVVKKQLQFAGDAAARAACVALPGGYKAAQAAAVAVAAQNVADGTSISIDPNNDITFGVWDPKAKTFTALSGSARNNANAVQVVPGRTSANGNAVSLVFAKLVGQSTFDVQAKATVCLTGNAGAYSIIGVNGVTMSLSAYTDSYNAAKSGLYSSAVANHKGAIASNGNISLSNNVFIDGDCRCGIAKTTTTLNASKVSGLNAPLGTTLSYPSVTLPASYTDLGDVNMSSGTISVAGGTYLLHSLILSNTAHIIWTGPVQLYIRDSYSVTGSAQIDTYNNLPSNRVLYFLPTCTTATWSGTNVCVGELYGPDTDFTISGSVELCGRITGRTINNSSSGGMHYDESLSGLGGAAVREAVSTVK
jgi:hypothetical protein